MEYQVTATMKVVKTPSGRYDGKLVIYNQIVGMVQTKNTEVLVRWIEDKLGINETELFLPALADKYPELLKFC